jgi:hypothetical protein
VGVSLKINLDILLKKTISCQAERDLCAGHFSLIIFFRNTGGKESFATGVGEEGLDINPC